MLLYAQLDGSIRSDLMTSQFFNSVRACVSLIDRYGLKNVIMAAREAHIRQKTGTENVLPAMAFRRYQVLR